MSLETYMRETVILSVLIHSVFFTLYYFVVVVTVFGHLNRKMTTFTEEKSPRPGQPSCRAFGDHPPRKQHSSLWVRARQGHQFTDCDYVMQLRANNISLLLSTMHGGSGSQSC